MTALSTPGIVWRDEEVVNVGSLSERERLGLQTTPGDLKEVDAGGRETVKMK